MVKRQKIRLAHKCLAICPNCKEKGHFAGECAKIKDEKELLDL